MQWYKIEYNNMMLRYVLMYLPSKLQYRITYHYSILHSFRFWHFTEIFPTCQDITIEIKTATAHPLIRQHCTGVSSSWFCRTFTILFPLIVTITRAEDGSALADSSGPLLSKETSSSKDATGAKGRKIKGSDTQNLLLRLETNIRGCKTLGACET